MWRQLPLIDPATSSRTKGEWPRPVDRWIVSTTRTRATPHGLSSMSSRRQTQGLRGARERSHHLTAPWRIHAHCFVRGSTSPTDGVRDTPHIITAVSTRSRGGCSLLVLSHAFGRAWILRVRPERTHYIVPQHDVLPVVRVRDGVVRIVRSNTKDGHVRKRHVQECEVKSRMVKCSQRAAEDEEEDARERMYVHEVVRDQKDGEQVVVLAKEEFEGMHVDRVCVAASGHNLPVVMLVNVGVHKAVMQRSVEWRVESIVDNEAGRHCEASIGHGELVEPPEDAWTACHEL